MLILAGCGPGAQERAAAVPGGSNVVDLCPMLDPATAEFCRTFEVASLVKPERAFSGADGDVVIIDADADVDADVDVNDSGPEALNPAGDLFVFQVWLTLSRENLAALADTDDPSWNIMQRGLADSAGGQWKLSLVTLDDGTAAAQCVVRDDDGNVLRVHSRTEFRPEVEAAVSCLVDDRADTLTVVVDKESGDVDRGAGEAFGDVAPHDEGDCWKALANQIAIGNKPLCPGSTLTGDDRFQGVIRQARILVPDSSPE